MSQNPPFPAPVIDSSVPEPTPWERERQAFFHLLPQLMQTHKGKYVAIHGGQVIDSDDDENRLTTRAYQKLGYVPLYLGYVANKLPIVRVPYWRELSRS